MGSRGYRSEQLLCCLLILLTVAPLSLATGSGPSCGVAVCFAIDSSGSIGEENFGQVKSFVTSVITEVGELSTEEASAPFVQFGGSVFSTSAKPIDGLSAMTTDLTAAKQAIANVPYLGGSTNMEGGLARCYSSPGTGILTNGIKEGLPRIIVLLTDGKPNTKDNTSPPTCDCNNYDGANAGTCTPKDYISSTDTSQCAATSTKLRADACISAGIKLVTVGIGSNVNAAFFETLGAFVKVESLQDLRKVVDVVTAELCSDVSVSKTVDRSPVPVGEDVVFTIAVKNVGPTAVSGLIELTDTLPTGLAFNSTSTLTKVGSEPEASCDPVEGNKLTCKINGTLGKGATWTYLLPAKATTAGTLTNTVEVVVARDNNPENNKGTCDVNVTETTPTPGLNGTDLNITKTCSASSVMIGSPVTFTITVKNTGSVTAEDAVITDTLPVAFKLAGRPIGCEIEEDKIRCSPGSLDAGEVVAFNIPTTAVIAGSFDNIAEVTAGPPEGRVSSGPVSCTVVVTQTCSSFSVKPETYVVEAFKCPTGYEVNGENAGNTSPSLETCCTPLTPNVSINKTIDPSEVLIGGNVTVIITVTNTGNGPAKDLQVTDNLPECLQIIGFEQDSEIGGNDNTDCALVPSIASTCPEVLVTPASARGAPKVALARRTADAASTEIPDSGTPGCTPTPPTGCVCSSSSLEPGATKRYVIIAKAVAAGLCTNKATFNYTSPGGNPVTGDDDATVNITRTCAVYDKDSKPFECANNTSPNPTTGGSTSPDQQTCCVGESPGEGTPSLSINKTVDGNTTVLIGSTVNFVVTVTNTGDADATDVTVTDTLGAGLTVGELLHADCNVTGSVITCGPFNITAGSEPLVINIPAVVTTVGTCVNEASATTPGGNPTPTTNATVDVYNTCEVFNAEEEKFLCAEGTSYNSSADDIRTPSQATCCSTGGGSGTPQLNITKIIQGGITECLIGSTITYIVTITNTGSTPVTGAILKDRLQGGLKLSGDPPQGCVAQGQRITCEGIDLPAGESKTFTFSVTARALNTRKNTATIEVPGGSPIPPAEVNVTVYRTCANFNVKGEAFKCEGNKEFDESEADNRKPNAATCCTTGTPSGGNGACCKSDGTCTEGPQRECKDGEFTKGKTCEQVGCEAPGPGTGACCKSDGTCTEGPRRECKDGEFTKGKTCEEVGCEAPGPGTGACCKSDGTCTEGPRRECKDGEFSKGKTCEEVGCEAPGPGTGACCKSDGTCTEGPRRECKDGEFSKGKTCEQAGCESPAPFTGACCRRGACEDSVVSTDCEARGGQAFNGTCVDNAGNRVCGKPPGPIGACCVGTDQCSVNTAKGCKVLGGRFQQGKACDDKTCSGAGTCIPSWLPCVPCTGSGCAQCCEGSSCQVAAALPSIKGNTQRFFYTCKPNTPQCLPEGGRCGDCYGGGVCCGNLICKLNFFNYYGTCTKPSTCSSQSQVCRVDNDCCPGLRCGSGRCTSCTCNLTCARSSFKGSNCSWQKKDCKILAAASARKRR